MTTKLISQLTPPDKFFPAEDISWGKFSLEEPAYIKNQKRKVTGARANGLRYERKAKEMLETLSANGSDAPTALEFRMGPWVEFRSGSNPRSRFCQPDCIRVELEKKRITIYEIKLQHCTLAWWQVRKLYEPVLKFLFPDYEFCAIEIVKWLDPHVSFPETFYYAETPFDVQPGRFGVHIYDGRKR